MRRILIDPRLRWFVAGAGFGLLTVVVLLAVIACQSAGAADSTFCPIQPGLTRINLPCSVVLIEVRTNTDRTFFWWRIAIVPKTVPIPLPPEKKPPEA